MNIDLNKIARYIVDEVISSSCFDLFDRDPDEKYCINCVDLVMSNNIHHVINEIKDTVLLYRDIIRRRILEAVADKFDDIQLMDSLIEEELAENERTYNELMNQMDGI